MNTSEQDKTKPAESPDTNADNIKATKPTLKKGGPRVRPQEHNRQIVQCWRCGNAHGPKVAC